LSAKDVGQLEFGECLGRKQEKKNGWAEGFHVGRLFELKLAELDGEIVNLFSINVDDGVFDSWIFSLEIEIDSSE
jgi:hypothetical protein